ncbi:MAG: RluA family pseudouridine synthase [Candidatus Saccharimonadales bacterium]
MKTPPFVANHEDNMHCLLACYRMLTLHFWKRDLTWQQAEAFTGFHDGKAPWTLRSLVQFHRMGLDIKMIEPFDYRRYLVEKEKYLQTVFAPEQVKWFAENSTLEEALPYLNEFLERIDYICRQAKLIDIDNLLGEGRLVTVTINSRVLQGKTGFASHVILIYDKVGGDYVVHDPGLPAAEGRKISADTLQKAMDSTASITGFKLDEKRGVRLDHWVTGVFPLLSRAYAAKIIASGKVAVNGAAQTKPGFKLKRHDEVVIDYDSSELQEIPSIDLDIIYEDDNCVVIHKPAGILVHSVGDYTEEGTVATWLRQHQQSMKGARGGIVHRLDRVTSGVMICAKNPEALSWLQRQFADRKVKKTYLAVVPGTLKLDEAIIDMPIERNPKAPSTFRVGVQGKASKTTYKVLETSPSSTYSLLELYPVTGRTHQLRVHLAHLGHPIVGDVLYGGEKADRLYLHAYSLTITLPGAKEPTTFTVPTPAAFQKKVQGA